MEDEDMLNEEEGSTELEEEANGESNAVQNSFIDQDLFLQRVILLIFFAKQDSFSQQLQFLNQQANSIQSYLEAANATLQALDQASQMPKQILG